MADLVSQNSRTTCDHIVSDGLGLGSYPVGTLAGEPLEGHVMGVVALAWMTRYPVEAWGSEWLQRGWIEMRFRRHLTPGRSLTVDVEHADAEIGFSIRDDERRVYASGACGVRAIRGPAPRTNGRQASRGQGEGPGARASGPVPATPEALDGLRLRPVRFGFDAARDLGFVERLADAAFWRAQGAAHPAWLGSAANAIVRHNVDFGARGRWLHAGLRIDLHAPVRDAEDLEISGRIESLFERRGRRFALAALEIHGDRECVASLENTFVYGAAPER